MWSCVELCSKSTVYFALHVTGSGVALCVLTAVLQKRRDSRKNQILGGGVIMLQGEEGAIAGTDLLCVSLCSR